MTVTHNLGFPRIGIRRELKFAQEAYWRGEINQDELIATGKKLRRTHWQQQIDAGIDWLPVGDFAWYDHMLTLSALLGNIPPRHRHADHPVDLDTLFRMARGRAPTGKPAPACEMTKWFDTNYHYIVPEFTANQTFELSYAQLFEEVEEAQSLGHPIKPVIPGPLTYLWCGKFTDGSTDKLALLENLLPAYQALIERLEKQGVSWIQLDEPILSLDLPVQWLQAFEACYHRLQSNTIKIMVASYFGALGNNLTTAVHLPVAGLHIDGVRAPEQLTTVTDRLPTHKVLSVGIVDGRNIWRTNLSQALKQLHPLQDRLGERLWLAPSCSLLHVPVDLDSETRLDSELKQWLAFAKQKMIEVKQLAELLDGKETLALKQALIDNQAAIQARQQSPRIHNPETQKKLATIRPEDSQRQKPFSQRITAQQEYLQLPVFPTTTIGSFPQTADIRRARRQFKAGELSENEYQKAMKAEIARAIRSQEELGLDVLVHGEAERNDMVEYFGEQLNGFTFTEFGWVQSYGSRCVKHTIIFGDIARPRPMTVAWSQYAQSLTSKPIKGMLTGPMTLLCWSFVRDDQPRSTTARQLALAIREEVIDLEAAGIRVIQIDEPALREGLPLRKQDWSDYLNWAVESFRLASSGIKNETQIHTHMCYAEFNDIIEAIADLDADVITIETSRSNMELLSAFEAFEYPNDIGPGVYDIHSPNQPGVESMVSLIEKATQYIPAERLWINPDCGLKTRTWEEVEEALGNMVYAAKQLRASTEDLQR